MVKSKKAKKEADDGAGDQDDQDEEGVGTIPVWSWLASAIGLVLVIGSSGFMINQILTAKHSPPEFKIQSSPPIKVSNGYLIRIQIQNLGDEVAAAILVKGELKNGEKTIESSSATIDYLPSRSQRNAGLIFSKDPASFELKIQSKSYVQP